MTTYVDGFVAAVPNSNRRKFIDHATRADSVFRELGAFRVIECWGDDMPAGKRMIFGGFVPIVEL